MKISAFAPIISSMFTDRMSINRYATVENPDNTTDTILPEVPLYQDILCRLSFSSAENPGNSEIDETPVKIIPKIFCGVSVDLRVADMIVVKRMGDKGEVLSQYSGTAGLASVYPTHKEVLFNMEGSA